MANQRTLSPREAVDNGVFSLKDYGDENLDTPNTYQIASKEYLYLLNFGMWEFGQELRKTEPSTRVERQFETPAGVRRPITGYALFNADQTRALPSLSSLRSIFQTTTKARLQAD